MTGSEHGQFPTDAPNSAIRIVRAWGPVVAWMALIFALSAQPGLRASNDPNVDQPIRHFAHVLVYAALAMLLLRARSPATASAWTWRRVLLAVLLAVLYGVSDEVHQTYVPQRTGHLVDVGWDLLGAVAGVLLMRFAPWRWLRRASVQARPD